MATNVTFSYGAVDGPICESPKTPTALRSFSYGAVDGPIVGKGTVAAGGEVVKTWDELAYASVKVINGLAVASIETIIGNASQ